VKEIDEWILPNELIAASRRSHSTDSLAKTPNWPMTLSFAAKMKRRHDCDG
jgi:hypothetical protein